jgi:hypothetical protein
MQRTPPQAMSGSEQAHLLADLAEKELKRFRRLPLAERKRIADRHLKAVGILTRSGRLAPGLS